MTGKWLEWLWLVGQVFLESEPSGDRCAHFSPHSLLWLFLFRLSLDRPRLLRLCSSSSICVTKNSLKQHGFRSSNSPVIISMAKCTDACVHLALRTWMSVCSISVGGREAACKTLWMRNVWSRDTSSRSPSSSSSSRWVLVAADSSTTCPFSEGSRDSRHPTPGERGVEKAASAPVTAVMVTLK